MSLERARALLHDAARIVVFSGAGLSAESGIATFRDHDSGALWATYDPLRLASPEGFAEAPDVVMAWYAHRRRQIAAATPNPAHRALAARPDLTLITQNVDDLLERAGASDVVHLHGTITTDRCHRRCGYEGVVDLGDPPGVRACPACAAPLRPGVVWFGERLPEDAWDVAERAARTCEVMVVVGTSAVVHPAAGLIDVASSAGAGVIVVNTQPSRVGGRDTIELLGRAGECLPVLFGAERVT